jgi:hypothetical protein
MAPGNHDILGYYSQPGVMTDPGPHAERFAALPTDVAELARVAQGLLVHEHLAGMYGVMLTDDDRSSVHVRPVREIVDRILARDERPLEQRRSVADRTAANCRHFTVLMVAMLRAQGAPARARCGFGAYFVPGRFEDHWVCEHWCADESRWALVDAQIDRAQRQAFGIDFELTDVPRDQFVVAGDAWARYRAGDADPDRFGLSVVNEAGAWWIAANLMRDGAALRNIELLPWDGWGIMPEPEDTIDDGALALFDHLAALTQTPDDSFVELQEILATDDRVRVPPTVRNFIRGTDDPV